ncbi:MAG TPA: hypothetical protein PKM88_07755 [bacterium]|nr:hypothetical protein [bacterium]
MKHLLILIAAGVLLLTALTAGCTGPGATASTSAPIATTTDSPFTPVPFTAGQTVHLQALVETAGADQVWLVTDWESRSRRSYAVISAHRAELAAHAGEIVVADGVVEQAFAFHGTIRLTAWQPAGQPAAD